MHWQCKNITTKNKQRPAKTGNASTCSPLDHRLTSPHLPFIHTLSTTVCLYINLIETNTLMLPYLCPAHTPSLSCIVPAQAGQHPYTLYIITHNAPGLGPAGALLDIDQNNSTTLQHHYTLSFHFHPNPQPYTQTSQCMCTIPLCPLGLSQIDSPLTSD